MGPQPFGCGRPALSRRRWLSARAFNGAATFRLRKAIAARIEHAAGGPPSMGPQPFGCGRLKSYRNIRLCSVPSMGPQPFGCGRYPHAPRLWIRVDLQWGRNLSVAEGPETRANAPVPTPFNGAATFRLRKGRALQMRLSGPAPFNGAATFRLRKADQGRWNMPLTEDLQWGRNLSVAEGGGRTVLL